MGTAIQFYSAAFMLMNLYDVTDEKEKCKELLHEHLMEFEQKYFKKKG